MGKRRAKQIDRLRKAAEPLLKFMNKELDPHYKVIVTPTSVELVQGVIGIPLILDYVKSKPEFPHSYIHHGTVSCAEVHCSDCGWRGCNCQTKVVGVNEDLECPVCFSLDVLEV